MQSTVPQVASLTSNGGGSGPRLREGYEKWLPLTAEALVHDIKADLDQLVRLLTEQPTAKPAPAVPAVTNRPKLNKREVTAIRALSRNGETNREIADIYGINPTTVSRIVRHQYHK